MNNSLKFSESGEAKAYYGNTIVSFVNDPSMPVYQNAVYAQGIIRKQEFASKLAFLPENTFHITVISLTREADRETAYWSPYVSRTDDFRSIDRKMYDLVSEIPFPKHIMMEFEECQCTQIILRPADAESKRLIETYRNDIAKAVGIRHSGHDTFRFHIGLAYDLKEFTKEQKMDMETLAGELSESLKNQIEPFELPEAGFVIFNDMLHYSRDLADRGNLY